MELLFEFFPKDWKSRRVDMLNLVLPLSVVVMVILFIGVLVWPKQKSHHQRELDLIRKKLARRQSEKEKQPATSPEKHS